jgi:hypothetical protein
MSSCKKIQAPLLVDLPSTRHSQLSHQLSFLHHLAGINTGTSELIAAITALFLWFTQTHWLAIAFLAPPAFIADGNGPPSHQFNALL